MAARKVSPDEKALSYIALGRLRVMQVDPDTREALVHVKSATVDGDPYYVTFYVSEWHCDCPARVNPCAHIRACQKIIEFPTAKPSLIPDHDPTDIDRLLDF